MNSSFSALCRYINIPGQMSEQTSFGILGKTVVPLSNYCKELYPYIS